MTEDDLIARYFAPLAGAGGLGLKDDAACVTPPPGCDLVVTVDALVAGVHFFPDDQPDSIARKALGVNLSDLAAKGADPLVMRVPVSGPIYLLRVLGYYDFSPVSTRSACSDEQFSRHVRLGNAGRGRRLSLGATAGP